MSDFDLIEAVATKTGKTEHQIRRRGFVLDDQPTSPATTSQVRAIRAICGRRKIDLVNLLQDRFGLHTADELGIRQASELIDELKADSTEATSSNGHYAGSGSGGAR